jgi:energy-coupling factor transporter ATP-binding protein EcfA2
LFDQNGEIVKRHIKTHSEHSTEDRAAVSVLETFLRSHGKINTNFSCDDKWPNIDGTFEFVSNPDISRQPKQNFFVQIKGTHLYNETNGVFKYSLKSLAFPATIYCHETFDPGILFVILNPDKRGNEKVFWKYMSVDFLNSIDFKKDSVTISFSSDEEILNTDESINAFCRTLETIINHHAFIIKLSDNDCSRNDMEKVIEVCNEQITESIDRMDILNVSRDDVSKRILTQLNDLCAATLLLNELNSGLETANLQLAWERSLLNIHTKYLGAFFKGLKYIDNRIPDDGQSERLMLKYYNFLWQIRKFLRDNYNIFILNNLEKFPRKIDELDNKYYEIVSCALNSVDFNIGGIRASRFYVQKKTPFFVGRERYYEVTLQLAGVYATKYNRITAYTKENISTNYSIQIAYVHATINLWGINSKIKVITKWKVSINPTCLNKLSKILGIQTKLNSKYGEYMELMDFLTKSGINFLDLIDLQKVDFFSLIDSIYNNTNTSVFKDVLLKLKKDFSKESKIFGRNTIRYLLLNLREETIESILPNQAGNEISKTDLFLSKKCVPFEHNPYISNLAGSKTSEGNLMKIANAAGFDKIKIVYPYLSLKKAIKQTGEIYFYANKIATQDDIIHYNQQLNYWERQQGYQINLVKGIVSIDSYEKATLNILNKLLEFSERGNKGQKELNQKFLNNSNFASIDALKKQAIRDVFVDSRLLLIYGAAGTGKTTLINYISNLMSNRRKLFLSKTHTAKQNLQRRIENPGTSSDFVSIDSFTKKLSLQDYDIIFVDECSTIDNRTMKKFLDRVNTDTFLVFAGDICQIESIEFGNWFYYAKDIINKCGANVELLDTWRTQDSGLISLWNEVRTKDVLITEKLVIDGPFSEDIGSNIFEKEEDDEVVLCLNYDGKFGLNNINNYFQSANTIGKAVSWQEWTYKEGDHILFNDTIRFSLLYNNLKGQIVTIEEETECISFTVDVATILTESDCKREKIEFIDNKENSTRIRFTVYAYDDEKYEENDELRMKSIIPFQLAYAVSIHKAQGLEYDSVKVIIPRSNSEKITHGIFYTAITRAKKKLKIYWSSETMEEIVKSFSDDVSGFKSLEIVKNKLLNK